MPRTLDFQGASARFVSPPEGEAMITQRDIQILFALVMYYVLNRPQIQALVFPDDKSGRITRRRLQILVDQNLINRQNLLYCHPCAGAPASVYYPSRKGCEFLHDYTGDERYLLTPTQQPIHHHLLHWLAVSDTHILLNRALAGQQDVQLTGFINEWDVVNKDEASPEKRYQLYTLIRENPRLICAPDAAFQLAMQGFKKVFYVEEDRATSGVQQIASSKTLGYAEMSKKSLHRRHFPDSNLDDFTVLMITPSPKRRDNLRKAIHEKPESKLWWFAATTELTAESFLNGSVWYPCDGEPRSLIKKPTPAAVSDSA